MPGKCKQKIKKDNIPEKKTFDYDHKEISSRVCILIHNSDCADLYSTYRVGYEESNTVV